MKKSIFVSVSIAFLLYLSSSTNAANNLQLMLDSVQSGLVLYVGANSFISETAYKLSNKNDLIIVFHDSCNIYCSDKLENVFEITNCKRIQIINGKFKHKLATPDECSGSVFYIQSSKNIELTNCDINGSGAVGVNASSTNNLKVEHCYLHDNSLSAYQFFNSCANIVLIENKLYNNGRSGNVSLEYESYTVQEQDIRFDNHSPEDSTDFELMLNSHKKILDSVSEKSYLISVNKNAPPKLTFFEMRSGVFPAEIFNNSDKGYSDRLWLIPEDNLIDLYKANSKLKAFDVETAYNLTKLSEANIYAISPQAIVNSVEGNELYISENRTVGVGFNNIPELDSILSVLRGKNKILIAAQKDNLINEIIKVHRKYIIANTLFQNTKFNIKVNAYFNIDNYNVNNQILSIHLSFKCITEKNVIEGVYMGTINVPIPLDKVQHVFRFYESFNFTFPLQVSPGYDRKGLGITGGGGNRWIMPNLFVREDPVIKFIFENDETKIQIIGLKGLLFPANVNTERWDLHLDYRPRSEYIRYLNGTLL